MHKFPDVGPVELEHFAIRVQNGKLEEALNFLKTAFRWEVIDPDVRGAKEDWGVAMFVRPPGSNIPIQLTEGGAPRMDVVYPLTHIGLRMTHPKEKAEELFRRARERGWQAALEPGNDEGTLWFLEIQSVFSVQFEFMPPG